jgi:GMP synthase (glutamine-hydrolysing)
MRSPFLIIETGQPTPALRRLGSYSHWIRVAAGLRRDQAVAYRVAEGEALPQREGFAGAIVSGSGAMVTERLDWSERTAQWLGDAARAGFPLFGICYGHQLIAHALGGTVEYNPRGREMGTVAIERVDGANTDPLLGAHPPRFIAHATHLQSVTRLPDGAVRLARSGMDEHHAFRWGDSAWGVQFHPEFNTAMMRGYIDARRDALAQEGADGRALHAAVRATPLARGVLRRFVRHARGIHDKTERTA